MGDDPARCAAPEYRVRLLCAVAQGWHVGQDASGLARTDPRASGSGAHAQCGVHRQPIGQNDGDGGAERGDDGGKKVTGRKRHLGVDTLGVVMALLITGAGLNDGMAASTLLQQLDPQDFLRLATIFADHKYHHHVLQAWMAAHRPAWRIEVKTHPEGSKGFTPLEKRWVMERTNAWHGRSRRNSKDYERKPESSAAMISMSHIPLMRRRLTSHHRPEFHDRNVAAEPLK
jgi:transposase